MKTKKSKSLLSLFLAVLMLVTSIPFAVFATDESGTKPADGTTEGRPFVYGSPAEMNVMRIPGIVTMDTGDLVAVADCRWNEGGDGGGNDTIVARSSDNGDHWNYTFVNYYPDNGNVFNKASTTVCDSAIATDGKRVYLLTTFFPAGYAINSSSANSRPAKGAVAFDDKGRVKLTREGDNGAYNYYLGEFQADGRARIYANSDNSEVSGYTVDHNFYLYQNGSQKENLFYSDCDFQTVKTNFLLFRTSDDNGATWSDFTLVNAKNGNEDFYGVGPGRGIVTSDGTIIFGAYSWTEDVTDLGILGKIDNSSKTQRSSFIYLNPGSNEWKRMDNLPTLKTWIGGGGDWTSECQPIELNDGTIRLFSRSDRNKIIYSDAKKNADGTYAWSLPRNGPVHVDYKIDGSNFDISKDCQYSAIQYSKKLRFNGKDYNAIVVSSALNDRQNGVITTLFLDDNNNIVHAVQKDYQSGFYAYSCMTELPDGRIAILFENMKDGSSIVYKIFDLEKMAGCRIVGKAETHNIDLAVGDERTVFTDESTATNTDPSVASVSFTDRTGSEAKMGENANFDGVTIPLRDALYDFKWDPDAKNWNISSQGVFLSIYKKGIPSTTDKVNIEIKQNGDYFQFVDNGNEALFFNRSDYTWDRSTAYGNGSQDGNKDEAATLFDVFRPLKIGETNSASDPVPGYTKVTKLEDIADNGQYLIGCQVNGSYYFLYPSLSDSNSYSHAVKCTGESVKAGSFMKISALKTGETTIVSGLDTYIVTVSDYSREILGVVDYDPVIYTHGDGNTDDMDHVMCGNFIADGTCEGERKTEYRMNSSNYTIQSIKAVGADGSPLENSSINFNNGVLSGTLSLADDPATYADFTKGTYVTLKTELKEESSGDVYTQTDRLYVTSNPVAGHVMTGTRSYSKNNGEKQLCTYILANGSIGNTVDGKNRPYSGVAKHMYTYTDTDTPDGMRFHNVYSNIMTDTVDKKAGFFELYNGGGYGQENHEIFNLYHDYFKQGTQVAYYYYDKSLGNNNEGITVSDKNHPENFEIVMSRQKVNTERAVTGSQTEKLVTIGNPADNDTQLTSFMLNDTRRSVIKKLAGSGSITEQEYMFGAGGSTYYINSADHQKSTTIQCSTLENGTETVQPNKPVKLNGALRYQEGCESANTKAKAWNDMLLTFEIRMCDKSNERNAYEATYSTIRKSTTYTEESWSRYMKASLLYQEYLNNYTIQTTDTNRVYNSNDVTEGATYTEAMENAAIDKYYETITKKADFTELEKAIEDNEYLYNTGIDGDTTYTPDSFTAFENAYNKGTDLCKKYSEEDRKNLEGYVPGVDTDTTKPENRKEVQVDIDNAAEAIRTTKPMEAADDDAYVAARAISAKIDKTAYTDDGAKVDGAVETGNTNIYKNYNGKLYVNLPKTEVGQAKLDDYTSTLLEEMNVSNEASMAKTFHVDFKVTVDGASVNAETDEHQVDYRYGTVANIDLTQFMGDEYTVKCIVNSVDADTTKKETEINLADCGYKVSILMQENLEVKVEVTTNPTITIVDYFGTVIATLNGTSVLVDGDKLTVGDITVTAVQAPKYKFVGWSLEDGTSLESGSTHEITSATTIKQVGNLNSTDHIVTAVNGKVNGKNEFAAKHLDLKMTLTADDANAKYWTRTVDGVTSLASYENNFVLFTANEDATFTAYNNVNDLPSADLVNQVNEAIPAVYATGYMANDKFVMSCDYSAPDTVKVLSAGVIYSNTASAADTLVKGASGTVAYTSNNISHWNGASEKEKLALSGTFTMSKSKNIYDGTTHYMRAFVCYTAKYNGKDIDIPYVAYSDKIYKCQNGVVTAVN